MTSKCRENNLKARIHLLSCGSCGTLMSHTDPSVQRRFKSNKLTKERVIKFTQCLAEFRKENSVYFRICFRRLGLMASALIVIPLGRLFRRVSTLGIPSETGPVTALPEESESDGSSSLGTAALAAPMLSGARGSYGRCPGQEGHNLGWGGAFTRAGQSTGHGVPI